MVLVQLSCSEISPLTCFAIGSIHNYLETHPGIDRLPLIVGIAKGLQYLHGKCTAMIFLVQSVAYSTAEYDPEVTHGDLKPVRRRLYLPLFWLPDVMLLRIRIIS